MADGSEKPIERVAIGDRVVTHAGCRPVTNIFSRRYTGDIVTVRARYNGRPVAATAGHEFAMAGEFTAWVPAEELRVGEGLMLPTVAPADGVAEIDALDLVPGGFSSHEALAGTALLPHRKPDATREGLRAKGAAELPDCVLAHGTAWGNRILRRLPITEAFGRLVGLFLAEGSIDRARVRFYFNRSEAGTLAAETAQLLRGVFGIEASIVFPATRPTVCVVEASGIPIASVFEALVPGKVREKRVPAVFMAAPEPVRLAVLRGWLDGDGYGQIREAHGHPYLRLLGVTGSEGLAADFYHLAACSGVRCSVRRRAARAQSKEAFEVSLSGPQAMALVPGRTGSLDGRGLFSRGDGGGPRRSQPVGELSRIAVVDLPVYDFEVEEDHSFIANGYVVHNCVGMSGAATCETTVQTPSPLLPDALPTGLEVDFSDLWVYYVARQETAKVDRSILRGEGAIVSHALAAVVSHGVVAYADWPSEPRGYEDYYAIERSGRLPDAIATAPRHRPAGDARRLADPDQVLEYLAGGYSVWIGISWPEGAMTTRAATVGGPPTFDLAGRSVGGHAVELLAYDVDADWIDVGNSWMDAGWGDEACVGRTSLKAMLRVLSAANLASGQSEAVVVSEVEGDWQPKASPVDWGEFFANL